jgi:hypothetical protein
MTIMSGLMASATYTFPYLSLGVSDEARDVVMKPLPIVG